MRQVSRLFKTVLYLDVTTQRSGGASKVLDQAVMQRDGVCSLRASLPISGGTAGVHRMCVTNWRIRSLNLARMWREPAARDVHCAKSG
jgi:hypothetical protein